MNETTQLTVAAEDTSSVAFAPEPPRPSTALLVLGMHRSGTSAMAGVLNRLGVYLGGDLMPATRDNPKGYFEHAGIVKIHDSLLADLGIKWDHIRRLPAGWLDTPVAQAAGAALRDIVRRDFAGVDLWALKDPRLCRLAPLWQPLLRELAVDARYVVIMRSPVEVTASLAARDLISKPRAQLLWLRHVLEAEAATRGCIRSILHYRDLIGDSGTRFQRVAALGTEIGVTWPMPPSVAAEAIDDLVAPELWHQRASDDDAKLAGITGWIADVERAFVGGDNDALHQTCDRVLAEMDRADEVMGEAIAELERGIVTLLMAQQARSNPPVQPPPSPPAVAPVPVATPNQATFPTEPDYAKWLAARAFAPTAREDWVAERVAQWGTRLTFAFGLVLPASTEQRLGATVRSLQAQKNADWVLHVAGEGDLPAGFEDERRLIWHRGGEQPMGTLNRVLIESGADWVGLIDAGDRLSKHALFTLRDQIERHPEWATLYSDEDRIDPADTRSGAQFKPDFNLDLLRSMPYIGGLMAVRRKLFGELGGFDARWDGLEECDLALRLGERDGGAGIGHIADILYHRFTQSGRSRRPTPEICADLPRLVQAHLDRLGIKATVEPGAKPLFCRVRYIHDGNEPLVSIVIPTKNQLPLLKRCIETVLRVTTYQNYEVIVVDNGSNAHDAVEYLRTIEEKEPEIGSRLRVLRQPGAFNFSTMNNRAVRESARGDYICLLNNDVAPLDGDWLSEMMHHARRPDVGAVGAKLFYPDGRVQHGGVVLGIGWGSPADHPFNGSPGDAPGYWGRLQVQQEYSAVTAACMVTRRSIYDQLGGLDEENFAVCFNDVDYCLRVREAGFRIVWTPYAKLLHETSASLRSTVEDKRAEEKNARFNREKQNMFARWLPVIATDPAYNRNLTSSYLGFTVEEESAPTWDSGLRPRPRVLVHPADREGCGEYRMIAPSRALLRAGVLHTYETMRLMTPPDLERIAPDTIVFQRQLEQNQIETIRLTKAYSRAFRVFEIDDLITNLPLKSVYRPQIADDIGQRMKTALSLCDRLVVSTEPLATRFGKLCDEVRVVPNRLERARWLGHEPGRRRDGKPRVGWAGAVGHLGDLSLMTGVLEATAGEVDWVFFGMCPDPLMPYVREFHEWVPLNDYPRKLASLDLDLAIAPLEYNSFNESKSNLRLLEYGVMGYPVICTDIVPYQGGLPVVRVKNRTRDWIKAIRDMVADRDACQRHGETLRDRVLADWMLEDHLDDWRVAWLR